MVINKRLAWLIGWIMVSLVCLLSLLPLSTSIDTVKGSDKLGHLLAYFAMTYWFLHLTVNKALVLCLFIIMGFIIEVLQGLSGYRYFEWADLMANGMGVLAAYCVFSLCQLRFQCLLRK